MNMKRIITLMMVCLILMNTSSALTVTLEGQAAIDYLEGQGMEIRVVDDWTDEMLDSSENQNLSHDEKCVVQPQLYCCARFKDKGQEFGHDISELGQGDAFSAKAIQRQLEIGKKDYGIYFKITPSWEDDGYVIHETTLTFIDPKGNMVFSIIFDYEITLSNGYFVSWNFLNLMDMFGEQLKENGSIVTGKYYLDVYFNGKWAGSTFFMVGR